VKIIMRREHTVRPEDYEAIHLTAQVEIDTESEADAEFRDMTDKQIGAELSGALDDLLDTDVDRTLRLDGQHIENTHLWVFYGKG
jgi:hypothetical protein